jgi:PDZ domain-containing protein
MLDSMVPDPSDPDPAAPTRTDAGRTAVGDPEAGSGGSGGPVPSAGIAGGEGIDAATGPADGPDVGHVPFAEGDGAAAGSRPRRHIKRRWFVLAGAVVVITIAVVVAAMVKVPYYLLSPGSVRATEDLIRVDGAQTYAQDGQVGYTTVSVQHATALGWLVAHLDDSISIFPEKDILGSSSPSENRQQNLQAMTDSKETASAVALSRLGYDVSVTGTGALVVQVAGTAEEPTPASGVLEVGDTVVSVGDTPVTKSDELVAAIGARAPGDVVQLGVQPFREDGTRTTELRTVTLGARPNETDKAFLGVSSATRDLDYHMPFTVDVDSGSVGGPSAGLAFTLGIMDVLTPDSITGGHKVATTGTINADGSVGAVGGVHQKTIAVRESGAELFLVPSSEYDEAQKYAGSLRIEKVDNVDDALRVLATIGGGTSVIPPAS